MHYDDLVVDDLTVYILTHNRPQMLLETLQSVLNQDCSGFPIVISDNSDKEGLEDILKQAGVWNRIRYVYRNCVNNHFEVVVKEVKTKYVMVFHDDDLMLPNMVKQLYLGLSVTEYSAIASNAIIFESENRKDLRKFFKEDADLIIHSVDEMFYRYFWGKGMAPYPSYMYRSDALKEIDFKASGGKYSDAVFLTRLLQTGNLYWIAEPLMRYRIHAEQDSSTRDWNASLQLLRFFEGCGVNEDTRRRIKLLKKAYTYNLMSNSTVGKALVYVMDEIHLTRLRVFVKHYKRIYIYGCGAIGVKSLKYLKRKGFEVNGFLVTKLPEKNYEVEGYLVFEFTEEIISNEECCVILGMGITNCEDILLDPVVQKYRKKFFAFTQYDV